MSGKKHFDVAIIGGGPAGSTTAGMIKKYAPEISVGVFEREQFPRDHVGESQLPPIGMILDELGCYDKVEAANFPIKIGATYRWGGNNKLWDFEFMPLKNYVDQPRPRQFEGQAKLLAFQVDRAVYDEILLKHAEELGAEVHMPMQVRKVNSEGDSVTSLTLDDGSEVTAHYYVDATGGSGLLRRSMGVEIEAPTKLQNVAFWDYWENADWAEWYGESGTRVLVLSIGCGWLWYIPLGPTRVSIGFVCPANYVKESKMTPTELYHWAIKQDPLVNELTEKATSDGKVFSTKDWSFISERSHGENWFLVGEAGGFADPILAAGLTLTHTGARELAYILMAILRDEHEPQWLKENYSATQEARLRQHIRFADFWYSANGIFTDLQEYTKEIAKDAGLDLDAQKAFQWLGTGGFTHDIEGQVGVGGFDLIGVSQVAQLFLEDDYKYKVNDYTDFQLWIGGAKETFIPSFRDGKITKTKCWVRKGQRLPLVGLFGFMAELTRVRISAPALMQELNRQLPQRFPGSSMQYLQYQALQVLEVMLTDGWVAGRTERGKPRITLKTPREGDHIYTNKDFNKRQEEILTEG